MNVKNLHISGVITALFLLGISVEVMPVCLHAAVQGDQACSCPKSSVDPSDSNGETPAPSDANSLHINQSSCCSSIDYEVGVRSSSRVVSFSDHWHLDFVGTNGTEDRSMAVDPYEAATHERYPLVSPSQTTPSRVVLNCSWLC